MTDVLMLIGGLVLLFVGGEALVKGAVALARNFGLSSLLVSAVVVGFGTSMPELTVSLGAAMQGSSDIAVGNVVGSNIANIILIVGMGAVLCPILVDGKSVQRDTYILLIASLALCGLSMIGYIGFISGLIMFLSIVVYIGWAYTQDRKNGEKTALHIEDSIEDNPPIGRLKASLYSVTGLILLISGAYVLVEGAVSLARCFNISEAVIGLTVVAVGTSLPEMVTTVVAAYRRHNDVIIGNILGSNIFNILFILGVTAMISQISITDQIATYDVWVMLLSTMLFAVYLLRGQTIKRISGLMMMGLYGVYIAWLYNVG